MFAVRPGKNKSELRLNGNNEKSETNEFTRNTALTL